LEKLLKDAGIETMKIKDLRKEVERLTGVPKKTTYQDTIVGVVEYRDGTVMDVIRQVE